MSEQPSFQTALSLCLECGHKLDGATPVEGDEGPEDGDFSVCIRCGNIARYNAYGTLHPIQPIEEWEQIEPEKRSELERISRTCRAEWRRHVLSQMAKTGGLN